jgi:hypothetical protein
MEKQIQTVLQSSTSYKNSLEYKEYLANVSRTKNNAIGWTVLCFFGFIFCLYFGYMVEPNNLGFATLMFLVPVIWYFGLKTIPSVNKNLL